MDYTNKPWRVTIDAKHTTYNILSKEGSLIATVSNKTPFAKDEVTGSQILPNAKLIAAAPDLLEAVEVLREALRVANGYIRSSTQSSAYPVGRNAQVKGLAAITKATE